MFLLYYLFREDSSKLLYFFNYFENLQQVHLLVQL
ncbi:hypothetical protein SP_1120 [Streptococcus pneumoniae TIGR4]|uniref:Uncharacterized protein n=1 Tax=Streptococcus pneumoniae serotype 4 (strain ATCC BAA-334 / TIGR4) TaxID=170187 RepID=A0A0H2UQ66_STRPN|nr:hypothetical protein SP_1120 [Streptococcus pneumoniae TIGR4]